jgi:hypothetical protein
MSHALQRDEQRRIACTDKSMSAMQPPSAQTSTCAVPSGFPFGATHDT